MSDWLEARARAAAAKRAHPTADDLARYILDALDPARKEALELHVFACEECAEGLAREARVEAALEQVARLADAHAELAPVVLIGIGRAAPGAEAPSLPAARVARVEEVRARMAGNVAAARRNRVAGGVMGALAAAAALVLAFASTTAPRPESTGMAQRAPAHDAAGDMSGAYAGEVALADSLDGG